MNEELTKDAFKHLNNYKRYRALHETATQRTNIQEAVKLELLMYKSIDQLELSLRGIQKHIRNTEQESED